MWEGLGGTVVQAEHFCVYVLKIYYCGWIIFFPGAEVMFLKEQLSLLRNV